MVEKYYEILGVNESVSVADLKRAYRNKAKELHPDVNKSTHAHDEFIFLNEAFEYLQNLKTGKSFLASQQLCSCLPLE